MLVTNTILLKQRHLLIRQTSLNRLWVFVEQCAANTSCISGTATRWEFKNCWQIRWSFLADNFTLSAFLCYRLILFQLGNLMLLIYLWYGLYKKTVLKLVCVVINCSKLCSFGKKAKSFPSEYTLLNNKRTCVQTPLQIYTESISGVLKMWTHVNVLSNRLQYNTKQTPPSKWHLI